MRSSARRRSIAVKAWLTLTAIMAMALLAIVGPDPLPFGAPPGGTALAAAKNPLASGWVHVPVHRLDALMNEYGYPVLNLPALNPVATPAGIFVLLPPSVGSGQSTLWRSVGGTTWTQVALDPAVFRPTDQMWGVFGAGTRLIVLGTSTSSDAKQTLVWVSTDGSTWARSREDPFGPQEVVSSVAGDRDLVAVGTHIWTSSDGVTWDRVPDPGGVFAAAQIGSVVHGNAGFVAVGSVVSPDGQPEAAVWTSSDGHTWQRVHLSASVAQPGQAALMQHIVAGSGGFLVSGIVSTSAPEVGVLWASPDGVHWTVKSPAPFQDLVGTYLSPGRIAAFGTGFVALDWADDETPLWYSSDGLSWTRLGGDQVFGDNARVSGLVDVGDGLVGLGSIRTSPRPTCEFGAAPISPLAGAAFIWTPEQSVHATPSRIDSGNPKNVRLRTNDVVPLYQQQATMWGRWINLCDYLPGLGPNRAYGYTFDIKRGGSDRVMIDGLAISMKTRAAARAAFVRLTPALVLPAPDPSSDVERTVSRATKLGANSHLGDQSRLFAVRVKDKECDSGQCGVVSYPAYAVLWRKGVSIGGIVVQDKRDIAVALARIQVEHLNRALSAFPRRRTPCPAARSWHGSSSPDESPEPPCASWGGSH